MSVVLKSKVNQVKFKLIEILAVTILTPFTLTISVDEIPLLFCSVLSNSPIPPYSCMHERSTSSNESFKVPNNLPQS